MPSWCSRALAALLAAGALTACDGDRCVRQSDCTSGLECRAGTCSESRVAGDAAAAALDGAAPRGDADAGDDDAGAARDAAADPDADVIVDAGADRLDASADAQSPQEDDGGGPSDLDTPADAGL